jgi:hypothetical protein
MMKKKWDSLVVCRNKTIHSKTLAAFPAAGKSLSKDRLLLLAMAVWILLDYLLGQFLRRFGLQQLNENNEYIHVKLNLKMKYLQSMMVASLVRVTRGRILRLNTAELQLRTITKMKAFVENPFSIILLNKIRWFKSKIGQFSRHCNEQQPYEMILFMRLSFCSVAIEPELLS